jgi:hypothetical protein
MTTPVFTYFANSRPIVATAPVIPLPINASDIYLALANAGFQQPLQSSATVNGGQMLNGGLLMITPSMQATISDIIAQQQVMAGINTNDPDYTNRFNRIQSNMRTLGLFPTGYSAGPDPRAGF